MRPDEIGPELKLIADMGTKVAIDDFGAAYSSFAALRAARFDIIKIDRFTLQPRRTLRVSRCSKR